MKQPSTIFSPFTSTNYWVKTNNLSITFRKTVSNSTCLKGNWVPPPTMAFKGRSSNKKQSVSGYLRIPDHYTRNHLSPNYLLFYCLNYISPISPILSSSLSCPLQSPNTFTIFQIGNFMRKRNLENNGRGFMSMFT